MSAVKKKGPLVNAGICRCCGSTKKCRLLNANYEFEGAKEVYSDMIMDCFGLLISHLDSKVMERLICATCVVRLREARNFKRQVLLSEEAFLKMKMYDDDNMDIEVPIIKKEILDPADNESLGNLADNDVGDDMYNKMQSDLDSCSNDDEPLVNLKMSQPVAKVKEVVDVKTKISENKDVKSHSKLHPLVQQELMQRRKALDSLNRQRALERQKILLKLQEDEVNDDKSYMILHNIVTIIENSYVCPFRCRHNNLHCYYCAKFFTDPVELRKHITEHSVRKFTMSQFRTAIKMDITNIDCRLCPQKINDLESLKRHLMTEHGKKFYNDAPEFILPYRLTKDVLNCVVCDKTFMYFHALNQHINEHYSNFVCETCGLGFVDQSRLISHKSKHQIGSHPCEICGKTFKNELYKDLHVDRVHKKLGKVYCPKCDIRLMSYHQKLKHLVEVHGESPLQLNCNFCEKVFESRRYLTLHLRKYHIKDYRYECEYCGHKFFTRFSLKNHLPTHTGERNFKCKICEKSYPRLKTLKEHTRIHTNDRRYRCHICGQAFIQNCSLKGHMRSQHPEYG